MTKRKGENRTFLFKTEQNLIFTSKRCLFHIHALSFATLKLERLIDFVIVILFSNLSKFGLNFQLPSTKFLQCQNVLRSVLKSSSSDTINSLWKSTSCGTNIQYDIYQNTKQVLKVVQQEHTDKLSNQLISQGSIISFLLNNSLKALNSLWSSTQSKLPKNIFNFTIRYLNNTLATRNNLQKWNLSQSSDCSFCLKSETLLHVVAGCKTYLEEGRYTWRHNSALHFIASTLNDIKDTSLFVDLPGFLSPCIITGEQFRPDMLLSTANNILYIIELTVGFETNIDNNASRKYEKYRNLIQELSSNYHEVKFINISISSLGIFGNSCDAYIQMYKDLNCEEKHHNYILKKLITIILRTTYYIFCMRNKPWTNPELLTY